MVSASAAQATAAEPAGHDRLLFTQQRVLNQGNTPEHPCIMPLQAHTARVCNHHV